MRELIAGCALGALAATALIGCGSDSNTTTADSTGATTLKVAAEDFRFVPASLRVEAGESVTVSVHNTGNVEHNLSVTESKVNTDVPKRATRDVSFTAPRQPGDYTYFCEYHRGRGMTGTIHVTGAAAGGGAKTSTTVSRGDGY